MSEFQGRIENGQTRINILAFFLRRTQHFMDFIPHHLIYSTKTKTFSQLNCSRSERVMIHRICILENKTKQEVLILIVMKSRKNSWLKIMARGRQDKIFEPKIMKTRILNNSCSALTWGEKQVMLDEVKY